MGVDKYKEVSPLGDARVEVGDCVWKELGRTNWTDNLKNAQRQKSKQRQNKKLDSTKPTINNDIACLVIVG